MGGNPEEQGHGEDVKLLIWAQEHGAESRQCSPLHNPGEMFYFSIRLTYLSLIFLFIMEFLLFMKMRFSSQHWFLQAEVFKMIFSGIMRTKLITVF